MADRYRPAGTNKAYDSIMESARQANRMRDCTDKECRTLPPRECGPAVYLSAAMSAIEVGIRFEAWDSVAEGLAMLEDLKGRYAVVLGGGKPARHRTSV
jgi:hypothetical protein